ncbi:MAG: rhomboid family intramembrane serine protease [Bacteroides sp.]|nr:rhomboid family intramembrane serine protease [Bacteroides sp.]
MKQAVQRIFAAMAIPLFILFVMYALKTLEVGLDWDFTRLGVYPLQKKGVFGIFAHPFVHSGFRHLVANTLPFFFLSWCLFYFYREIAPYIFFLIWICCGVITFLIGKPGWHVGASGIIYGLAFFLFFSGILRKHVPLIAISLLVTFLYGGMVWNMFPFFAKPTTSWEGHLSGAVAGTVLACLFRRYGPQKPVYFSDEEEEEIAEEEDENADTPPDHTTASENKEVSG